jgi:hypothetical protein
MAFECLSRSGDFFQVPQVARTAATAQQALFREAQLMRNARTQVRFIQGRGQVELLQVVAGEDQIQGYIILGDGRKILCDFVGVHGRAPHASGGGPDRYPEAISHCAWQH